jgi:hypothetical protein
MDSLNEARLSSLKKTNTEKPETVNMSTLYAARQGALPRKGNEDLLRRAASNYESGTPQRRAFAEARRSTEYGRLGGKSRRRNKKGKKKTSKRRRRN